MLCVYSPAPLPAANIIKTSPFRHGRDAPPTLAATGTGASQAVLSLPRSASRPCPHEPVLVCSLCPGSFPKLSQPLTNNQRDTQNTRPRQPTFIDGLLPFFLILEPLKEVFGFFQQPPRTGWLTHESAVQIRLLTKTQNKHRPRNSSDRPLC